MRQNNDRPTWFYTGGSALDRTDDFQKFFGSGLDRIQFFWIIGLGLKNFTVRSSLLHRWLHTLESAEKTCSAKMPSLPDARSSGSLCTANNFFQRWRNFKLLRAATFCSPSRRKFLFFAKFSNRTRQSFAAVLSILPCTNVPFHLFPHKSVNHVMNQSKEQTRDGTVQDFSGPDCP